MRRVPLPLALFAAAAPAAALQDPGPKNIGFHHGTLSDLAHPVAVAFDREGRAWVAEAARGALAVHDEALGLARRVDLRGLLERPSPAGIAIDEAGRVLVSDADQALVLVLDAEGRELDRIGTHGLGPGELHRPRGLDARDGRVAVADEGNHQVVVYDAAGELLFTAGGFGHGPGELVRPADVALAEDGTLYVADAGNSRVQVFDAEGNFVRGWGDFGPFPGLFAEPSGIDLRADRVFVADQANHRLQVFRPDGTPLYEWGEHAVMPLDGRGKLHYPAAIAVTPDGSLAAVVETADDRCQVFGNSAGSGEGERMVPAFGLTGTTAHYGTEIAAEGDWIAIAAPEMHQVLVFETTWRDPRLVTHVGDLGTKAGLLRRPQGLALDGASRSLWVGDSDLRRVSLFRLGEFAGGAVGYDPTLPRFVKSVDLAALGAGALPAPPEPGALARDGEGKLYVCDLRNDRVLVLDPRFGLARTLGGRGAAVGELVRPSALALDAAGRTLWVVDAGNARLQAFDLESGGARVVELGARPADPQGRAPGLHGLVRGPADDGGSTGWLLSDAWRCELLALSASGSRTTTLGSGPGLGRLEFRQPRGLAVDQLGRWLVIDHSNHRVQVIDPSGEFAKAFGSRPFLEPTFERAAAEEEEED